MSAAKKYGVLLVTGAQTHQENYGAAFAADPRAQVIAVSDEPNVDRRRRGLNEKLARAFKVPYIADLADALQRKDVDVVCICTEPERRGRVAVQCAQAGKHLYLDKSLVPALSEADALVAAVKKAGVKSHMFSFISTPWAGHAKRLLRDGHVGKLAALHADAFFAKGKNGTAKLGKPRKEEYPPKRHQLIEAKREFDNVGVYGLTLIHWLTGKKFKSVYAVTGNYFFAEHQKHDVEDFGVLSGTLEDGVMATVAAGRYGWTSHPAGGANRITLIGARSAVTVDANRPRLEVYSTASPWQPPEKPHPEDPMAFWSSTTEESGVKAKRTWLGAGAPARSDAAYFLDCLDAGRDSELAVEPAAHVAEVLLAAYRSAATKEVVSLPLPR